MTSNTPPSSIYSDWSAAEEAASQAFKGMWEIEFVKYDTDYNIEHYSADYIGELDCRKILGDYKNLDILAERLANEYITDSKQLLFVYCESDDVLGSYAFRFEPETGWKMSGSLSKGL